jgi:hypothetical protein
LAILDRDGRAPHALARGIVHFTRHGCANRRRIGARKNPAGADFDHDDLHDELQCAGGVVPIGLFCAAAASLGFDSDDGTDRGPQSDCEHFVHHELHQRTARLSDDLRQSLAIAVTCGGYERRGA